MTSIDQITHPHVTRDEQIAKGKAIIVGTRIKVAQVALEYERLGWTPDQIVEAHPHLTLAQVHDALSYYYDHQTEIDSQVAADEQIVAELEEQFTSRFTRGHANQDLRR